MMLGPGDAAPSFKLRSHAGETISSVDLKGSWVVLHTFPFAFTGG
ncbi:MAG: redoxin domain-containing protein [Gammaproteobacteria bacterium]|nr:redoxin domain-containing protein [Gammaproteobacteria bacterium]MYB35834.1 redoxin domain-containing protein [Gammaproteobacteria bacterium]